MSRLEISGTAFTVDTTVEDDDRVRLQIGTGSESVTLEGSRFYVHRLIIEADRQLGRFHRRCLQQPSRIQSAPESSSLPSRTPGQ